MATITLRVPDDGLALIDTEARGKRAEFIVSAARDTALMLRRKRVDGEVAHILADDAERDLDVLRDWSPTMADGVD